MYAFSGVNGAEKSTLLKVAWIVQKAYFLKEYNFRDAVKRIDEIKIFRAELLRYLSSTDSYIKIGFNYNDKECFITLKKADDEYGYTLDYTDLELTRDFWNLDLSKNLILYIDASKSFSEETLKFDAISIKDNDRKSLAFEAILHPELLFSGIYRQLVRDYIHERLLPSKPPRYFYYQVASKIFTTLIPNVELSNFSGNHKPGEFVFLGKANRNGQRSSYYDVREFSSGEKALFSTLTFLCMSRSVSVLIIDEPENHFHESLLLEFMNVLYGLCEKGGLLSWIQDTDVIGKDKLKESWLESEYRSHILHQVIISTHSKSLIYKFFSIGHNFIINDGLNSISYDEAESKLRKIGLSSTYSKVILVEGDGDSEVLEYVVKSKNIKIKPLGGSNKVIENFKQLASINVYVQDSKFVFLVDSDNKSDNYFKKIRDINPDFYDKSFIRLNKHEFENYFLDTSLFKYVIDQYLDISRSDNQKQELDEIHKKIIEFAIESLPRVYKKETSLAIQHAIERHFSKLIWGNQGFEWKDPDSIQEQLSFEVLTQENLNVLGSELKVSIESIFSTYRNENLDDETILNRCDGKQVFGKACSFFSKQAGVDNKKFKKAIIRTAIERENSELSNLISSIYEKFEIATESTSIRSSL